LSGLNLNSAQERDRRTSAASDELLGDEQRQSVLSLGAPTQSYTSDQTEDAGEPMAGGGLMGSSALEFQRMQQQEQRMRETQQQFTGAAATPSLAAAGPSAGAPSENEEAVEATEPTDDAAEEADEDDLARQLAAEQAEEFRQQAINEAKERALEVAKQQAQRLAKRAGLQGTRYTVEGAELATSETIIPLVILFVQLNIQMVMKYFFRPLLGNPSQLEGVPFFDQSLPEDFATVAIDISMCCNATCCNPLCAPMVLLIAILAAVVYGLKTKLGF